MANLEETREWAEGIYQLEKTDRVLGGADGVANRQGQQLANRTLWLKEKVESTESALTEHEEADDPHPQYVTEQEMTDYVGTVIVQGQVNADWNATDGAAYIKNKPVLSAVATSGNYADLQNKPSAMTGATAEAAGTSGFVPVPAAGDEDKVLKGDGTWGEVDLEGIVTELNGKADKDLSNISENIAYIVDSYHDDEGNWYRKWSDGWVEQGGLIKKGGNNYIGQIQITFLCPLSKIVTLNRTNVSAYSSTVITNNFWYSFESISNTGFTFSIDATNADSYWYVAGIGAE